MDINREAPIRPANASREHPPSSSVWPEVPRRQFSSDAVQEVAEFLELCCERSLDEIQLELLNPSCLTKSKDEIQAWAEQMDEGTPWLAVAPMLQLESLRERELLSWVLGNVLGRPIIQDVEGRRLVHVYDRSHGDLGSGARFHQTRQGGYIHNDQTRPYTTDVKVIDFDLFDYLVLTCGTPARFGGESILVEVRSVVEALKAFPDVLKVLQESFWFENRGEPNGLYKMPLLSLANPDKPEMRYFGPYSAAAHEKAGEPLTPEQSQALSVLETILEQSDLQTRMKLQPGETLVTLDGRMLHGRTSFIDGRGPASIDVRTASVAENNRIYFRVWARRRTRRAEPALSRSMSA